MGDNEKTTEDAEDTVKPVKSDVNKVENNKSAFYIKINGFLFGSFNYHHYLCISERNKYYKPFRTGRQPISGREL